MTEISTKATPAHSELRHALAAATDDAVHAVSKGPVTLPYRAKNTRHTPALVLRDAWQDALKGQAPHA